VKRILELTLGIVTSVGGFLEVGSIATAAQGGAAFQFQLTWAIVLGTICLIFLVEMSGRLAAVSKHTVMDAIRERFGFPFSVAPLVTVLFVSLLVMASEIGGVCLALQFVTGIGLQWWAIPGALLAWALLWKGTFGIVEQGVSALGLVTIAFLVAAIRVHPSWGAVAHGALPSLPAHDRSHYWFLVVSILGASISPYLFLFYSSGAVEDKWDESYLSINRVTAGLGMSFGGTLSVAVLIVAAMVFFPRGIQVDSYDQMGVILSTSLGHWGFWLFAASLGIACFGATAEIALSSAYMIAQEFGWNWSEDAMPAENARFVLTYTAIIAIAAVPMLLGVSPLKLTVLSMALTSASLPVAVVPFLLLMNDERYLGKHTNGVISNTAVIAITVMACVLAVVSIPLELVGG
jgi:Mn2+/Fe2+ NRAMP family transporter